METIGSIIPRAYMELPMKGLVVLQCHEFTLYCLCLLRAIPVGFLSDS